MFDSVFFLLVLLPACTILCWWICSVFWSLNLLRTGRVSDACLSLGFWALFVVSVWDIAVGLSEVVQAIVEAVGVSLLAVGAFLTWIRGRPQNAGVK